jgi:hypothetical protein
MRRREPIVNPYSKWAELAYVSGGRLCKLAPVGLKKLHLLRSEI